MEHQRAGLPGPSTSSSETAAALAAASLAVGRRGQDRQRLAPAERYIQCLEWLHQLRSEFPNAFSTDEWDQHVSDFETWLQDDLSSIAEDMSDTGELAFVDRVADLYGLTIDDEGLDRGRRNGPAE